MRDSVFLDVEFLLLMLFSIILPLGMYGYMIWKRAISRRIVLLFGLMLVAKSGVTIFLLQRLATMARSTPSLLDDRIFDSSFSIALYFVPVLLAGIGVKMLAHVLASHLGDAEGRSERERTEAPLAADGMDNDTAALAVVDLASLARGRRPGGEGEGNRRATASVP